MSAPNDQTPPGPVLVAIELAAEEFSVTPDDVELIGFSRREWPSPALGCPRPGMVYAQVITPGYVVELRVTGTLVHYHTNMTGRVVRCPQSD